MGTAGKEKKTNIKKSLMAVEAAVTNQEASVSAVKHGKQQRLHK